MDNERTRQSEFKESRIFYGDIPDKNMLLGDNTLGSLAYLNDVHVRLLCCTS